MWVTRVGLSTLSTAVFHPRACGKLPPAPTPSTQTFWLFLGLAAPCAAPLPDRLGQSLFGDGDPSLSAHSALARLRSRFPHMRASLSNFAAAWTWRSVVWPPSKSLHAPFGAPSARPWRRYAVRATAASAFALFARAWHGQRPSVTQASATRARGLAAGSTPLGKAVTASGFCRK